MHNSLKKVLIIIGIAVISFSAVEVFAHEKTEVEKEIKAICDKSKSLCEERKRFSAYQPNHVIWQFTKDDQNSLGAHYSFRYVISNPDCMSKYNKDEATPEDTLKCLKAHVRRSEYFITYTGDFDFYAFTRDSSPVINRVSNPAAHYRKYWVDKYFFNFAAWKYIDFGIEHMSDGQAKDAGDRVENPSSDDFGRYETQVALERGDHEFFDSISRSANFISVEGRFQIGENYNKDSTECKKSRKCFDLWVRLKPIYFKNDSEVTWGSAENMRRQIQDYDRMRLILSNIFPTKKKVITEIEIGAEWTIGEDLFDTDSLNLNLVLPMDANLFGWNTRIPWYIRYHSGPMRTFSDYTKSQDYIGFGLRFK